MRCDDIQAQLADHLAGSLDPAAAAAVAEHVGRCEACAAEVAAAEDAWQQLGGIGLAPPDSAAMRARFDAMLAGHGLSAADSRGVARRPSWRAALQAAAAVLLAAGGMAVGRATAPAPGVDPQIAGMRAELREMRQMVTLSLLQQQSASERLRGITYTSQIDPPGNEIAAALLDALRHDVNDNVRLRSVDALKRFADRESVRRQVIESIPAQTSPLVQIALIDFVLEVNGREAADTLRRISSDPTQHTAVRARAELALQRIG